MKPVVNAAALVTSILDAIDGQYGAKLGAKWAIEHWFKPPTAEQMAKYMGIVIDGLQ